MKRKSLFYIFVSIILLVVGCSLSKENKVVVQDKVHPVLQMLPVPMGLGVNIHFFEGNENDLQMLKESGVGIVRMDVSWVSVEKEKGKYDLSKHDKLIENLDELGIRLLFIIDYGNPNYDSGLAPHTKEGREAYIKFCSALAERYSGKNIIWELWNEPNSDKFWQPGSNVDNYMAFCKAIVPVIREKDKSACIIAPATSAFDMKFMDLCFEQGLLDLVDGVSVHPYRNPELSPETIFDELQFLSLLIEQHKPKGKAIPIISGEWGYSTFYLSRELQGKYLARQWLFNNAYNIPISIWYDWHDDGQDPNEAEHNFGTVTWDYKKKPSFTAMKTLTKEFSGYKTLGRISLSSVDDYMALFKKKDEVKLALWSVADKHKINFGENFKVSESVNYLGKTLSHINGSSIELSDEPMYIKLAKPYPNWVKLVFNVNSISTNEAEKIIESFFNKSEDKITVRILDYLNSENPLLNKVALYSMLILANKTSTEKGLEIYYKILNENKDLLSSKIALLEIAKISSAKSLDKVLRQLNNPKLQREVSLYLLNLSYKMVKKEEYGEAEKLLVKAVKFSPPQYAVERILNLMKKNRKGIDPNHFRNMANSAGFINDWYVAGPFVSGSNINKKKEFISVKNIDITKPIKYKRTKLNWREVELEGVFPIIPLAKYFGKIKADAYAFTKINFDENTSAILKIGSNDGVVCWVNGEKVHEKFIGRSLAIDEDIVSVKFKKGMNHILLKVLNEGNNWEACLRICDAEGVPLNIKNLK